MSDKAESPASRLWRDQVQLREHERDEARARTRISEEKVAILTAENDRLADEIARLRALLTAAHPAPARAETEQQMEDLRTAAAVPVGSAGLGATFAFGCRIASAWRIDFTPDPVVVKLLFEEKRNPRNQTTRLRECPALKRMAGLIGRSSPFKIRFLVFSHAPSAAEVLRADPLRDRRFAVQHAAQMLNALTNILKTSTISPNLPLYRQRRAGLIPARSSMVVS